MIMIIITNIIKIIFFRKRKQACEQYQKLSYN